MNFSPDDPKLTAYALGELPANEVAEVEAAVKASPELQAAVAEIRQTAELLQTEFAAEPGPALSPEAKAAVVGGVPADNVISLPQRSFWKGVGLSAIAATIACVLAWQFWSAPKKQSEMAAAPQSMETDSPKQPERVAAVKPSEPEVRHEPVAGIAPSALPPAPPAEVQTQPSPRSATDKLAKSKTEGTIPELHTFHTEGRIRADQPVSTSASVTSAASPKPALQQSESSRTILADAAIAPAQAPATIAPGSSINVAGPGGQAFGRLKGSTAVAKSESASTTLTRNFAETTSYYAFDSGHLADGESEWLYRSKDGYGLEFKEAEQSLRDLNLKYTPGHPKVVAAKRQLEVLRRNRPQDTARYPKYQENDFQPVREEPLSTFSIDVDTASYANVRRFLNEGRMPPRDAVRIEEMINYFSYDYPQPKDGEPFAVNMEVASCPWTPEHRLVRVGIKGKEMAKTKRPASNFVFLIDVSGSMSPQERLPLIKQSLRMLVKQMTENDRIAIVVYASSSGVVLDSTSCVNKEKVLEALDRLEAGGSTNGGQGIQKAYSLAEEHFIKGGVNRVILCTDGDFNVGITDQSELIELIQRKAKSGVFLSILGVGTDNYKDALMQKLADKGNGNYHYLDSVEEGHKVLVQQMNGTLVTIAKDVKIQIEFNPYQVSSYRLIGYEKRILAAEDFNNDKKDAGEIGAGHTVTALYEIVPAGMHTLAAGTPVEPLKYQKKVGATPLPGAPAKESDRIAGSDEMLTLKLRYKKPDGDKSVLREHVLKDNKKKLSQASTDFRFAAAVAGFGMVLKESEHKGAANYRSILEWAGEAKGDDKEGYRAEFINLVKKARDLHRGVDRED